MYTEKHSNLLQKYNSCRLLLPITHKYSSSHEIRKHRHIFARVAAFWQRVFQTLPNLDVHPGVAVYHTLKIFSIVNAKDLLMPHTKFQVCTLKINAIFCHRKKKSHYFWTGVYILGTALESVADTWTSHMAIAAADLGRPWCDWTYVAWQMPTYDW